MAPAEKRTFSLPREQSDYIDELVASGTFASGSEVIRAGLRALRERDIAVERWLTQDVVPVVLATQADPQRAIPLKDVFDEVRRYHQSRHET
ncbi:MAG: type II toxin-antitoxin system ParD family antitoxin [Shinella sp.]|uniref:ribbon-helix-helix domain-containing protein n=1 Tax=Shinella sp. TaxID=1870904 RepID=UPI003C74B4B2